MSLGVTSGTFPIMLLGRFLQGIGIAAPSIVLNVVIQDRFEGSEMARVVSVSLAVLILVPIIARTIGQIILMVSEWRGIIVMFLLITFIALTWFGIRLNETLERGKRVRFNFGNTIWGVVEIL